MKTWAHFGDYGIVLYLNKTCLGVALHSFDVSGNMILEIKSFYDYHMNGCLPDIALFTLNTFIEYEPSRFKCGV